ncbi:hypothetical protein OAR97_06155 [Arcobacteraceae bacterium]|nr:hypothetical protein [Arcobacteraceae bacterium]
MSLKEDVNYIKKEISAEESYMESVFKIEKTWKRYKTSIIGLVAVIIIAIIGLYISDYFTEQNKIQANTAFNTLLKNPNDKEAKAILEVKNPELYKILQYKTDDTKVVEVEFFKDLALYTKAMEKENVDELNTVTLDQNFILKDFALFNKALIQAKSSKYSDAKETLKLINTQSPVAPMAKMLSHFLLTK